MILFEFHTNTAYFLYKKPIFVYSYNYFLTSILIVYNVNLILGFKIKELNKTTVPRGRSTYI